MTTTALDRLEIVRSVALAAELRADGGDAAQAASDSLGTMDVRFSPFNSWYRISSFWEGDFLERTVPGAFKRTFNAHRAATAVDAHNIKTLFNHGADFHIGDKLLGEISDIREERDGPVSTVDLWDTSYNRDLLPGLKRGAYGSSFMFTVIRDQWDNEPEKSDHNPDGIPERTLKEVRVYEAGPVTWPANPAASAGMRSIVWSDTDKWVELIERRDPERVSELRSLRLALATDGPAHLRTLSGRRPANTTNADSTPIGHSGGLTPQARRRALNPDLI